MASLRAVQFVNIILMALVAGLLWGTWFSLSRSMDTLSAQTFLDVGHTMIRNIALPARIVFPLTFLSSLVVTAMQWRWRRSAAFWLPAAGTVLFIGTLIITVAIEVPIDNQIKTWTVATLPADWHAIRDRWELHHTIRTFLALSSLGAFVAGSLLRNENG